MLAPLQGLEEKVAAMEARSEALEIKYSAATRTIEALKTAIHTIFEETGCSTPATLELLGGSAVTESNVLQFLALIEQRACEIMQVYMQRVGRPGVPPVQEVSESHASTAQGPVASPAAGAASAMVLELPSAAEDFDASEDESEEEDDERPLTREELQARMQRRLQRQASRGDRPRHGRRK